ncbi:hypothetical protein TNCV_3197611 [Trichonephila clavipes]|nr:hypothetical protein TNCV_3197611 [Trichonephila clavipes]
MTTQCAICFFENKWKWKYNPIKPLLSLPPVSELLPAPGNRSNKRRDREKDLATTEEKGRNRREDRVTEEKPGREK